MRGIESFIGLVCLLSIGFQEAAAQDFQDPVKELSPLVEQWNTAIDLRAMDELSSLYLPQALVYGQEQAADAIVAGKENWLEKHPDYRQEVGEIYHVLSVGADQFRAEFLKVGIEGGQRDTFSAYLLFEEISEGEFKIAAESDRLTDQNLGKKARAIGFTNRKYCFTASGTRYTSVAIPAPYSTDYDIAFKDGKLIGEGSWYSSGMRTMHSLEIEGISLEKGVMDLRIRALGPMYPDDPKDYFEMEKQWKFDGKSLIWIGGDESDMPVMRFVSCR